MPTERPGLRPEARSVQFRDLSQDQRNAFDRLIQLLIAATGDLPGDDRWRLNPEDDPRHDDEERSSRVLFLDGERGSGKTTVVASLRDALRSDRHLGDKPADKVEQFHRVEQDVARLRDRVILLDTLGMESAPADTNILAALLARIEQRLFPGRGLDDSISHAGRPENHEAVLKLLRLQTDVALAWNGNLTQRGSHLDPDNYAMEELRVERVRLQLRRRFASVLRSTARDALGRNKPSLFLLVVDDIDLNPDQLIELVDRLRMVGVAELAVLLVGDLDVMETVFRLEFAARFQGGQRGAAMAELPGMTSESLGSITDGLALAALRKHVPTRQRVKLRLLEVAESLALVPLGQPDGLPLGELMSSMDVLLGDPAGDDRRLSLTEFIGLRRWSDGKGPDEDWYSGSIALEDNARTIVDLWNLVEMLVELARQEATDSETGRNDEPTGLVLLDERSKMLRAFVAGVGLQRLLNSARVHSEVHRIVDSSATIDDIELGNLASLGLRAHHPFEAPLRPPPTDDSPGSVGEEDRGGLWAKPDPSLGLSPVAYTSSNDLVYRLRLVGARSTWEEVDLHRDDIGPLILAEDLRSVAEDAPHSESTVIRSMQGEQTLVWVVDFTPDDHNTIDPSSTGRGRPWALPQYRLMRQVEEFGYRWNRFLDGFSDREPAAENLALAWIMIHTEVLAGLRAADHDHTRQTLEKKGNQDAVIRVLRRLQANETNREGWAGIVALGWLRTVRDLLRRYNLVDEFGGKSQSIRTDVNRLLEAPDDDSDAQP